MPVARLALFLSVAVACSSPPAPDAGEHDAGVDASPDAGHDAAPLRPDVGLNDATVSAGDGGPRDGGPRDGGPNDPGWVRLPGLPPDCPIERAAHPEQLWDLEWQTCTDAAGDMVEGCSVGQGFTTVVIDAWHDSGQVWLNMLGGSFGAGRIVGIAPVDGPLAAAWREPPRSPDDGITCAVTAVAVGGGRAAFVAHFADWTNMTRSRAWLYVASPDAIGVVTEPVHTFPAGFVQRDRTIHDLWISDQLVALQTSPDGSLYTYRDGEWATLTGGGTVPGLARGTVVIGAHVLWEAWTSLEDVRLVHAQWDDAATVWMDASPGNTKGFGSDGVDMAWFQNHDRQADGTYARSELWTAGYTATIETVSPRRVREVELYSTRPAVGDGWLALRRIDDGPQRVEVFSLEDGSLRTFVAPDGFVLEDPYYASERDIMFRGRGTQAVRFDPTLLPIDGG